MLAMSGTMMITCPIIIALGVNNSPGNTAETEPPHRKQCRQRQHQSANHQRCQGHLKRAQRDLQQITIQRDEQPQRFCYACLKIPHTRPFTSKSLIRRSGDQSNDASRSIAVT